MNCKVHIAWLAMLCLCSCSLSEPESTDAEGAENAGSLRLSSVSFLGADILRLKYDEAGRISEIRQNEMLTEFTYSGTAGNTLEIVKATEYDTEYNYSTDKEEVVETNVEVWTNIRQDSEGRILSCDYTDTSYSYSWSYITDTFEKFEDTELGTTSFKYDSEGHLLNQHWNNVNNVTGQPETDDTYYIWDNGRLLKILDEDEVEVTFEYCDVKNTQLQWDPFLYSIGALPLSGYLGTAPSWFISREIEYDNDGVKTDIQISYNLLGNGLIHACRRYESGEGEVVTNFKYEKK
ncbi:MAG: hypothetical protein NC328_08680 [Muribaculum sp.]|nr:hypothetical protein [Muribaculum sp.]